MRLTQPQIEILQHVAAGDPVKAIAAAMKSSESYVSMNLTRAKRMNNAESKEELLQKAVDAGLIEKIDRRAETLRQRNTSLHPWRKRNGGLKDRTWKGIPKNEGGK